MESFTELRVWQEAMNMVEMIYRLTKKYPKEELFGLISQTQRAAVSIPANIAEGNGRLSGKEYLHFLSIANGSLRELETLLIIAQRITYIQPEELKAMQEQLTIIGRMITALRKSLKEKRNTGEKYGMGNWE